VSLIAPLPYSPDSARLFEPLADAPWAVFLDSGCDAGARGRYDIIAAEPSSTLVTRGEWTEIARGDDVIHSRADPFALLREALGPMRECLAPPFCGGAIGYFGYDLGRRIERLPSWASDDEGLPQMAIGLYDWAVVVDHLERRSWIASAARDRATPARWDDLVRQFQCDSGSTRGARPPFRTLSPPHASTSRSDYERAFARIQRYIVEGDCYQVNLAQRFEAQASGDGWSAYAALRRLSPAPHAAYLRLPFAQVLSASPERFLAVRAGEVETRPIKGTRPRSADPLCDVAQARALAESEKDRAENVMIVDLLRNDLAKNCTPGSVRVPRRVEVE
jgi:para-aminobenzoate synthetase component 1